ncbi:MAG: tyramine oxidase, partial [Acidobacteriota bacterium]|nr:tyramine oxidase [Acidobacteriota bacterium]
MKTCADALARLRAAIIIGLLFLLPAFGVRAVGAPPHPLDPLSAEEIGSAVKILRAAANFPKEAMFSTVVLNEPSKADVLNFKSGAKFRREAFVVVLDREKNLTYEATIDLRSNKILSWKEIAGVQPLVFVEEYEIVPRVVKADVRWQAAMRKRGITDFDKVQIDTWAAGQVAEQHTGRLLRALSYLKDKQVNFYGRPIEGVVAIVNMNTRKVVEVTDTGVLPLPPPSQEFDEKSVGNLRERPQPLVISQPAGVSFQMNGQEIRWQKWRFRYTMHPREGLVLH